MEKVTYQNNNKKCSTNLHFNGMVMEAAHNLKEINMDDPRLFILDDHVAEVSYIFLENIVNNAVDSKQFLVHK